MSVDWFKDKDEFINLGGSGVKEKILCLVGAILDGDKNAFYEVYKSMKGNIDCNINVHQDGVYFFVCGKDYSVFLNTMPEECFPGNCVGKGVILHKVNCGNVENPFFIK